MKAVLEILTGKTAQVIHVIPHLVLGLFHFMMAEKMAAWVPIPGGVFWVYLTGLALVAGAVGVITDFKGLGKLAAFLLGVLVLVFVLTMDLPAVINAADEAARSKAMPMLLKNLGLVGGSWAVSGVLMKES